MSEVFCETCGLPGKQLGVVVLHKKPVDSPGHSHSWRPAIYRPTWELESEDRGQEPQLSGRPDVDFTPLGERIGAFLIGLGVALAPIGAAWMWFVNQDIRAIHLMIAYLLVVSMATRLFRASASELRVAGSRPLLILIPVVGGVELTRLALRLVAIPRKDRK